MRPLSALKRLNADFHQRVLLPISLWLTLERGTAFVMMLFVLSLFSAQGTVVHAAGRVLGVRELPLAAGIVGALCIMVLLSGNLTARWYHVCLLPMFGNALLTVWAAQTHRTYFNGTAYTWSAAILLLLIWLFFYIAGVKLPNGGTDDHRPN